eukprot:COSAG02_NODE_49988_length_323_cov_0.924107_2_plen_28_part_01
MSVAALLLLGVVLAMVAGMEAKGISPSP